MIAVGEGEEHFFESSMKFLMLENGDKMLQAA